MWALMNWQHCLPARQMRAREYLRFNRKRNNSLLLSYDSIQIHQLCDEITWQTVILWVFFISGIFFLLHTTLTLCVKALQIYATESEQTTRKTKRRKLPVTKTVQSNCQIKSGLFLVKINGYGEQTVMPLQMFIFLLHFSCTSKNTWDTSFSHNMMGCTIKSLANIKTVFLCEVISEKHVDECAYGWKCVYQVAYVMGRIKYNDNNNLFCQRENLSENCGRRAHEHRRPKIENCVCCIRFIHIQQRP